MDFLKIAIGNNVDIDKLKDWTLVPIDQAKTVLNLQLLL